MIFLLKLEKTKVYFLDGEKKKLTTITGHVTINNDIIIIDDCEQGNIVIFKERVVKMERLP